LFNITQSNAVFKIIVIIIVSILFNQRYELKTPTTAFFIYVNSVQNTFTPEMFTDMVSFAILYIIMEMPFKNKLPIEYYLNEAM